MNELSMNLSKMAVDPLEEKINKIRLQNEEIKRRHEEVEADKKNAAKLNALVQMVPSTDWPERKEPPEFSSPPINRNNQKQRNTIRENNVTSVQYRPGGEGKKMHTFGQNEGPPPDPKYNFLADSEREEHYEDYSDKNKNGKNKLRLNLKKKGNGREWQSKEVKNKLGATGQDSLPDYEAWRAERNKIDEARISRQRTAEGNWKREWDNDKIHLVNENTKRENGTLGDAMRYNRISDKNSLMSVKVSSPNIAGTGRVGPRQRTRVMYSSQSECETMNFEVGNFVQPKQFDEKKSNNFGNSPKSDPKILHAQRRKEIEKSHSFRKESERNDVKYHRKSEGDAKSPGPSRRDFKNFQKSPHVQRRSINSPNYPSKSPRVNRKFGEGFNDNMKQKYGNESKEVISQIKNLNKSKNEKLENKEEMNDEIQNNIKTIQNDKKKLEHIDLSSNNKCEIDKSNEVTKDFQNYSNNENNVKVDNIIEQVMSDEKAIESINNSVIIKNSISQKEVKNQIFDKSDK